MALDLILVRHGETEWNRLGLIQGLGAAPLNSRGREQAEDAARLLRGEAPFVLYTSPLLRAAQTAEAIARRAGGITAIELPALSEMDVGELDGLEGAQLRELFPEVMRQWDENPDETVMPGGESMLSVQSRAWRAVRNLATAHESETVIAVTHNFTIQAIVCAALDMPLKSFRKLRTDLGSITRLRIAQTRISLLSLNETCHLGS